LLHGNIENLPVKEYLDGLSAARLAQARALSMHVYSGARLKQIIGLGEANSAVGCASDCGC
jgi:hypothetical protein